MAPPPLTWADGRAGEEWDSGDRTMGVGLTILSPVISTSTLKKCGCRTSPPAPARNVTAAEGRRGGGDDRVASDLDIDRRKNIAAGDLPPSTPQRRDGSFHRHQDDGVGYALDVIQEKMWL